MTNLLDWTPNQISDKRDGTNLSLIRLLVDLLPCSIFWKDTDSVFLGSNKYFADSAGLGDPSQIVGKTDYDLPWDKTESEAYRADDQAVMATRQAKLNIEETITLKDGSCRNLLTSKVPLFDGADEVSGVLCFFMDITERKQAERELEQAKKAAEAANNIKTEFIHNMQHDIRTPFSGILGMAQILFASETDTFKKDCLNDIVKCSEELLEYCNTIFEYSKIELGEFAIHDNVFDIAKLCHSVVNIEKLSAKHKQLDFSFSFDQAIPKILVGDESRVQRILINILSNAIKFTEQGSVSFKATLVNHDIEKRLAIVLFEIADTGIGIPEHVQRTIYESFSRGSASYKGVYKGTGLGLRLVKQFISELEGEINLKSAVGSGTTFSVFLPLKVSLSC